jgi:hypothetical protein
MARKFRLRVLPSTTVLEFAHGVKRILYRPGDEFVVSEQEAAQLLRDKGRRSYEVVEVYADEALSGERN